MDKSSGCGPEDSGSIPDLLTTTYHKIQSLYKRDPENNYKTFLDEYSRPEFKLLESVEWVWTEKIDGTNIRVMWDGRDLTFGGRTDKAQIPAFLIKHLMYTFQAVDLSYHFGDASVVLYGEGYGPKIQKGGGDYRDDPGFILFDVRIGRWWLTRKSVEDIAEQFQIPIVPIVLLGTFVQAIRETKEGFSSLEAERTRLGEGLVGRPPLELFDRKGDRIITKIKHKDWPQ